MIQAMTTGHEGSLSTGHANTPPDMLRRLETMILMTGYDLPMRAIREQIASAVDVIVHTARLRDGSRKIVSITEVYGVEDDDILTQEIFVFEQTGMVDDKIEGQPQAHRHPAHVHAHLPASAASSCRPASTASRRRTRPAQCAAASRAGASAAATSERPTRRRLRSARAARSTPAAWSTSRRHRPGRSRDRPGGQRRYQAADAPVPGEPQGHARGGRQLARARSCGPTGRCARPPSSTPSTRSGCAGSPTRRRWGRARSCPCRIAVPASASRSASSPRPRRPAGRGRRASIPAVIPSSGDAAAASARHPGRGRVRDPRRPPAPSPTADPRTAIG